MKTIPRRQFIHTTAIGAATLASARTLSAQGGGAKPPLLRVGVIGCGWYGMLDMRKAFEVGGVECVALCDVDSTHLEKCAAEIEEHQGKRPRLFKHYAEMLELDDLDIVIIGTPPHWHALPFIAACERGLDIYCEKPLAYDVREGRAMVEAAKKHDRVVQVGFQRRSSKLFHDVRDYIRDGNIGRVVSVEASIDRPMRRASRTPMDPPATLDWDLWCGPAPLLPYSEAVGHFNWRSEQTTGHGHLVDWGIHLVDVVRWVLGAKAPNAVTAAGGIYALQDHITTPDVLTAHFDFAGTPLTWSHRAWGGAEPHADASYGITFYAEKATLFAIGNRWSTLANEKGAEPDVREVAKNTAQVDHMADFLDAVRERRKPACLPEDGHFSTSAVVLAMIAYETGRTLKWDTGNEQIIGDNPAAAALLKREYRAPWQHPWTERG